MHKRVAVRLSLMHISSPLPQILYFRGIFRGIDEVPYPIVAGIVLYHENDEVFEFKVGWIVFRRLFYLNSGQLELVARVILI